MRRVCVDGGIVAIRDADYATMVGHPEPPCGGLDRWRTIYSTVARSNNAEPNAGKPVTRNHSIVRAHSMYELIAHVGAAGCRRPMVHAVAAGGRLLRARCLQRGAVRVLGAQ